MKIDTWRVEGRELSPEKPEDWGSGRECVAVKSSMYVCILFKKKKPSEKEKIISWGDRMMIMEVKMGRNERKRGGRGWGWVWGNDMNTLEAVLGTKERYSCHRFYTCHGATELPRQSCA